MNKTITTLVILISFISNSQCIKGDCDNGNGTKIYERGLKGKYEGQFKDKLPEGKGKFTYSDFGHNFEGYFTIGDIDSNKVGVFTYENGSYLKGFVTQIIENNTVTWELNGAGEKKTITDSGDYIEKGNFIDNILNDENGEIKFPSGNVYIGGVVDDKRQGLGKMVTPSGGIQNEGSWYDNEWVDRNEKNPYAVKIAYDGYSIMIDVDFDGTEIEMVLDTGASITSINKFDFYSLVNLEKVFTLNEQDGSFTIANGDEISGTIYTIKKMKIGNYEIDNVPVSVIDGNDGSNLLGLDALLRASPSKSFSIDVEKGELNLY